jgi:subtilisin family serine protease
MLLGSLSSVQAATIAIIDSGLDYKHEMIVPHLWTNANEVEDRRDNDGNGYQDDVHGWNFAEQNGQIIDYKYLGTFSADCTKYFEIQGKMLLKQATEAEIAWLKGRLADKKFLKEMGVFGNFVHGTHVAGIASRDTNSQVMGIKLLPTEVKLTLDRVFKDKSATADRWELLNTAFTTLAAEQMKLLAQIASFAASHKAEVANGSFGTGFKQAKMITDNAFKILFFRKPTAEESDKASRMFIEALVSEGQKFVAAAPDILFVFAAGNDGMDNDAYGSSPANIRADNVITVGATYKNEFLASFSNYGKTKVDIAAPGMIIESSIPGNAYLKVSGTSQAAPAVANVAARIKEANPKLKPVEVKKILLGTVDKKGFLTDKILAGGIVNTERAVVAAQLTTSVSVSEAISRAKVQVKNMPTSNKSQADFGVVTPIPLAPMFK